MDDLEVIRLAAIENIAKERVARASVEVKENFGKGGEGAARGLPDPIYRDFLSPGAVCGRNTVLSKECRGRGFTATGGLSQA